MPQSASKPRQHTGLAGLPQTKRLHPGVACSLAGAEGFCCLVLLKTDGHNFTYTAPSDPVIFFAYDPSDAFARYMWSWSTSYLGFLAEAPLRADFVILAIGAQAEAEVATMERTLTAALDNIDLSAAERAARLRRLHFVAAESLDALSARGGALVAAMLQAWPSYWNAVQADAAPGPNGSAAAPPIVANRLDASSHWLPGWTANHSGLPLAADLSEHIAVVPGGPLPSTCSYADIVASVQAAGGAGVLVGAPNSSSVVQMDCMGAQCDLNLTIPASMIPPAAAEAMQDALTSEAEPRTVKFGKEKTAFGRYAAIDGQGRLQQVGYESSPTLALLAWEAQWLLYTDELERNLSRPSVSLPVFTDQKVDGTLGISADLRIPDNITSSTSMQLYLGLSCDGAADDSCPEWDHVVQAHACCADSADAAAAACAACEPTSWRALPPGRTKSSALVMDSAASGAAGGFFIADAREWPATGSDGGSSSPSSSPSATWRAMRRAADADAAAWRAENPGALLVTPNLSGACGPELGRWVTPYRRRVGRWLTEASHLRPLLAGNGSVGGRWCQFRLKTAPWATGWRATLDLRLGIDDPLDGSRGELAPVAARPLFQGGTFDANYNANRAPARFATPAGIRRAVLAALITGHGSDDNNCAEFCPTTHTFTVNRAEHTLNFSVAGTDFGCAAQVRSGVIPNQHGTWLFGRAGWCPGGAVRPWLVDVTGDLLPAGGPMNAITYKGLFQGAAPVIGSNTTAGYIMMSSQLVFYR
ncbi:hypothetical protein WJX81_008020 [Elliptochloris bilobata]|uniref:Peptide-N-glycosidase F N-terminal domain-containing protein n=1 Tax=Elliptochloris bilobata TaxID=381761 RepID=A0AAW1SI98_9CHLO